MDGDVGNQDEQVKDLGDDGEMEEKKDRDISDSESEESNANEEKVKQEDDLGSHKDKDVVGTEEIIPKDVVGRSLRAKNFQAQQKPIDLTGKKKKEKQRKRHKAAASDDSSVIGHEQAMEELRSRILLSQLENAKRDIEQINEIKRLREQLEFTQPLIAASVLHGHYPQAPPLHGQQYYQGMFCYYISSSNH